jgi:RNA polymerase sigma factor (sigma-70 family)
MPPPAEGFAARFVLGPALRTQPDRRLVTLVQEGYENAFEEIVRRYGKPLTRYAAAIVGGRAEDITQDAFSKALLALRRDGAEIELRPWLFRIVRNTALNELRDRPPSAEALAEVIASGGNPADELERREELTELIQRLQSLPEAQRAAIVMRELEGLSHEEIANALGLSDGGARQAIYRARRTLRDSAGMLLPLPLLKALLVGAATTPAVEAAAGAAGVGGVAGAGVALKAAAVTVLVAGAVGAGVAIDYNRHGSHPERANAQGVVADDFEPAPPAVSGTSATEADENGSSGRSDHHRGGRESSDDRRSPGEGRSGHGGSDDRLDGEGDDRGHGGSGSGHLEESTDDHGERSGPSRHDGSGGDRSNSGRSSGGSSGPGSGSSGDGGIDDNSGPGSGSVPAGESSGSIEGSGSNGGPGSGGDDSSSGGGSGSDESSSGDSGDSGGDDGFSIQTEPQSQEEP